MNSREKVLFVITKSNFGGAQRYIFDLATHTPADMEAVVVCGPAPDGKPGELVRRLQEKNVRTILIPELERDMHIARDVRAFQAIRTIIQQERPRIVHVTSSKAGGLGSLAARMENVHNIIFTAHGLPSDEERPPIQRILIAFFTWCTALLSHHTIAISRDTYERIRAMPFTHPTLIHPGLATPQFLDPKEARKEICTRDTSLPEKTYWVGSIGELHPNKGYGDLIGVLTKLPPDMHIVVVGAGELHESLHVEASRHGVSDRFHLVGFMQDAATYLRAFDCFVLPSHKEGLPYVLLEAGFGNIPVIATAVGGIGDVINTETGVSVSPGDTEALREALTRVRNDSTESRRLAGNLLKHVQRTFSFETMLEKTYALYRT